MLPSSLCSGSSKFPPLLSTPAPWEVALAWSGGLGAASRYTQRQLPGLSLHSLYGGGLSAGQETSRPEGWGPRIGVQCLESGVRRWDLQPGVSGLRSGAWD